MKTLISAFFVLGTLCISCENDIALPVQSVEPVNSSSSVSLSEAEAIKLSNQLLNQMDTANRDTKGFSMDRRVKTVEYVRATASPVMRTAEHEIPDTLVYLINYENEQGFSIVSADKRLPLIYAISEEGHLDISDTIENKGLALFFKNMEQHILRTLAEDGFPIGKEVDERYSYQVKLEKRQLPLLWPEVGNWHQNEPFNQYCFTADGKQASVGCVAVAMAQLMSYFDWPREINGQKLMWRSMKKGAKNSDVALLMKRLGDSDMLNMNYGVGTSGASVDAIAPAFNKMGYTAYGIENFLPFFVEDWLSGSYEFIPYKQGPVIVIGTDMHGAGSHVWIVDGYIQNSIYRTIDENQYPYHFYSDDFGLFHCIWGWRGSCNGYFFFNTLDVSGSPDYWGGYGDDASGKDIGYDFGNIRCLLGVYPNN